MRKICIINHKGGVGKTTTAVNLAAGLSRKDKKVLLVDLDPQSNVALSLKVDAAYTIYDALKGSIPLQRCVQTVAKNFDVITSKENLVKAEHYLASQPNTRLLLKQLLESIQGYDYVLVDCPPSLGILNQNVMAYCNEAFIPTSTDFMGFDALQKMQSIIRKVNENYGHDIKITRVIPTLFDRRTKISKQILQEMKEQFPEAVTNPIRVNSKLKEAPRYGKSIFKYARSSPGAKDYGQLVDSIVEMGSVRITQEVVA